MLVSSVDSVSRNWDSFVLVFCTCYGRRCGVYCCGAGTFMAITADNLHTTLDNNHIAASLSSSSLISDALDGMERGAVEAGRAIAGSASASAFSIGTSLCSPSTSSSLSFSSSSSPSVPGCPFASSTPSASSCTSQQHFGSHCEAARGGSVRLSPLHCTLSCKRELLLVVAALVLLRCVCVGR